MRRRAAARRRTHTGRVRAQRATPRRDARARSLVAPVRCGAAGVLLAVAVLVHARLYPAEDCGVSDAEFALWSLLVLGVGLSAGLASARGLGARREVARIRAIAWGPPNAIAAIGLAGLAGLLVLAQVVGRESTASARGAVLTLAAGVGGALIGRAGVGIAAAQDAAPTSAGLGARVADHLLLRDLSRALLPWLGSLVALTTLALGVARLPTDACPRPDGPVEVLVFGLVGTALVAGIHAIPRAALRRAATELRDLLAPVDADDADALRAQLRAREETERMLGLTTSLLDELQAGVWVAGPLLTALAGLAVSGL